jgi:integrase
MPRQGSRRRIARAIYEDKSGRSGIYRDASGKPREVRFAPFTPISEIRAELDRRKAKSRGSGQLHSDRGTLAHAVDRWEPLEQHLASWKERRAELRAWVKELGHLRLTQITDAHVRTVCSRWATALTPKTLRNRLWSLRHLYKVLHGPETPTPVDHINPPAKVRHVPTPIPATKILEVYGALLQMEQTGRLRDANTRARFMVRAATGRRPSEIMRARPEDVDLGNRIWRVRDGKGGWSEGLYLNDDMQLAWVTFAEANAWGDFNTGSMAEVLRAAGWPKGIRPYQLRHSIGIGLSEAGIDLADVGAWLGHTSVQTTRSIYAPVLNSRMQRASQALDGRLKGWKADS